MNTKQSTIVGWLAYTLAFGIGGGIGYYKYWYAPGGRKDREEIADKQRSIEAAREAEEEQKIREQRRRQKQLAQSTTDRPENNGSA